MAYQVLARKYRPQRFEDVVGQRGVTQTLRNAIDRDRLAHAFVFAGPRGVGKTTTARILARALNCEAGPTAEPCGTCDACVEIAEGRDIDVLEIDAATHTQVDKIREVVIAGLSMAPVRDRYKVFIIDEFHQLSSSSFNALLKSMEEPPAHVVFMMATTELRKIPDTILSRSQVYELRTIGTAAIMEQLRRIAGLESVAIDDAGLALVARAAEGSMRDAQSAFDQVIAFAGNEISVDDVSAVLGLVGRELVLDAVEVVASEEAARVFDLAGRFSEAGLDLKLVCRELARVVRDMMVIGIDPTRASDPEIATDAERDRLVALAGRFSREDLLRAFDVLAKAEFEIRTSNQPRYHFEMALLKWMHLRHLVPLTELLEQGGAAPASAGRSAASVRRPAGSGAARPKAGPSRQAPGSARPPGPSRATDAPSTPAGPRLAPEPRGRTRRPVPQSERRLAPSAEVAEAAPPIDEPSAMPPMPSRMDEPPPPVDEGPPPDSPPPPPERSAPAPRRSATTPAPRQPASVPAAAAAEPTDAPVDPDGKAKILAEIKRVKKFFHGTVVAQAKIELRGDRLVFAFTSTQKTLAAQLRQNRVWLEETAAGVMGRPISVTAEQDAAPDPAAAAPSAEEQAQDALRQQAMSDPLVQSMLEVFPAEIGKVEKIE